VLFPFLLIVFFLPAGVIAETQPPAGQVKEVRGKATAAMAEATRTLAAQDNVFIGENVATGAQSRAELRLGQTTTLRLGDNARIKIDRFLVNAGGVITLESGPLLLDKDRSAGGAPVEVRGPFGLIVVRGTKFFAGPSNGVFGVFVVNGRVRVTAAGRTVALYAGQGTEIRSSGARPTPPRRWSRERTRSALASVD
jgi:hypothetical protein